MIVLGSLQRRLKRNGPGFACEGERVVSDEQTERDDEEEHDVSSPEEEEDEEYDRLLSRPVLTIESMVFDFGVCVLDDG